MLFPKRLACHLFALTTQATDMGEETPECFLLTTNFILPNGVGELYSDPRTDFTSDTLYATRSIIPFYHFLSLWWIPFGG